MKKTPDYSVSVIIPCYNEEGNVEMCVSRVPKLGKKTEMVVVDDGSKDRTAKVATKLQKKFRNLKVISYKPNRGKGNAVRTGMGKASGDILVILDADMAVPPEDLPRFVKPLAQGKAGFVNGTRLILKMEKGAMGKINKLGNKLMALLFSFALGQRITDTLCGTKALFKEDYKKIGIAKDDPWGDFSLIFGAAKLGLRVVEVPVEYKRRVVGKSKMKLIEHGVKLLKVWLRLFYMYKFARSVNRGVYGYRKS